MLGPDRANVFSFPAGEWNKTRDTWAELTDQLLRHQYDRQSAIVGLGGGVAGDLAGFVAATFLRGVPLVQLPTSLLAMVDSAIGGKTGVDTTFGKNLVGAFHHPRVVIADVATLRTLPPVQLAAGMAEVIKHGAIADAAYLDRVLGVVEQIREGDASTLVDTVSRSVEIKAGIVGQDEREQDRRAILNFGHTVAHALETLLGYELLHGEAVAVGMVAEATIGEAIGVTEPGVVDRVRDAVARCRLPLEPPTDVDRTAMLDHMKRDKKARAGTVRFALLHTLGSVARDEEGRHTIAVPERVIEEVLRELW
jgi:3-dehydroquinate synthase